MKDKSQRKEAKGPDKTMHDKLFQEKTITIAKEEYLKLKEDASRRQEYWDKFLRQQAEFENFRKRLDKEKSQFLKYANQAIILEILTVLDDLERAVSLAEKHKQDFKTFLKGVEMILAHLYEVLKKQGVRSIDAKNKKFDPLLHEALMSVESDREDDNKIIEELQKGYLIEDRVLRTAKVKVAKKSEVEDESTKGKK